MHGATIKISYCIESYVSISKVKGKLTVYLNILPLQLFEQRKSVPNIYSNESKIHMYIELSKNINCFSE